MKKKLNETRTQIENATKITQADKDHLKTTQQLITQTKTLVDEKLRSVNTKHQEGQLDTLRLWKPLQEQVEHFQSVLTAVEKRPYCVNVAADEPFLDLLSLNHEPIIVQNESAQWTPLHPTMVYRTPTANSFKRSRSFTQKRTTFKDPPILRAQVSPRTSDTNVSFPRSRSSYRTVPVTAKTSRDADSREHSRPQSIPQKLQERNPTILPRLSGGGLTSGETSKVFNIRSLKLKGISLQSIFEFPCEDIIVMENFIITITERSVQKFSLRYQFLEGMTLRAPIKLCYTRDDTCSVLVLDSSSGISLITSQPRLKLLYRVETDRA